METVLSVIVEQVVGPLWNQGIKKHASYIFHYQQNVDELHISVKDLENAKDRLSRQRDQARRNGHNVEPKVTDWLQKVDEFETKLKEKWNNEDHKKSGVVYCLLPHFRYRLGRLAKNTGKDAVKLINECPKSDEVSYPENVTSNEINLFNPGYVEFGSRKSVMKKIMAELEDPFVKFIGLHGPSGAGKSFLTKEIGKRAREELFYKVARVEVTVNPNTKNIQEEIAHVLGMTLEGESENVRADRLQRSLKKAKDTILIILDDIWPGLDLNKLGIPVDKDYDLKKKNELSIMSKKHDVQKNQRPVIKHGAHKNQRPVERHGAHKNQPPVDNFFGDYERCKIILSSQDKEVFPCDDSIFHLEQLDDNDALKLFKKVVDNKVSMSIEDIKKHCGLLPMEIVTFAKDKCKSELEGTIDEHNKQDMVDISIKKRYDSLENDHKFIFLLLAQMGPRPLIKDLVKYCFGLGIFKGVYSLSETQKRIYRSIERLKELSVGLDESSNIHLSMPIMVRHAALSIAHKDHNAFILRNGKLDEWPKPEKCTSISICNSDIIDGFPKVRNFSQLSFFQIENGDPSLKVPDDFFKGMKNLKVLILIGFHLSSLPSSIKYLSNLRMLCLEKCILSCNLCIIGVLQKLRILSFSGSQIQNLPTELRCLDKLQLLDISDCFIVDNIPPKLISSLICLEELYIRKSLINMLVEGETIKGQNSFLCELKNLDKLKAVDLSIPCASVFPNGLFFNKLNDYKIVIGDMEMFSVEDFRMPNKYEADRVLALQLKDDIEIHSQEGIKLLFKTVQNLLLGKVAGVQNVVQDLNTEGFPDLKHLSIINNNDIKYVNLTELSNCVNIFPNLESLYLYNLRELKMICYSPVTAASFAKLKIIKIEMCYLLENLYSFYTDKFPTSEETCEISECNHMDKFLASLEIIEISECKSLKEIFQIPMDYDTVEFLMLKTLTFHSLPSFTSFYTEVGASKPSAKYEQRNNVSSLFGDLVEIPNLENLNLSLLNIHKIWSDQHSSSFNFQNLIKLVVQDCNKLTYLCSLSMANSLKKLESLTISECPNMEKIFETGGSSAEKVCIFPKLEEIHISKMKGLTDMWHTKVNVDSFSSLISVHIEECNKLDKIFPSHMEGWFESLENLKVSCCKSVEVIFEIKDSKEKYSSSGIDTNLQLIVLENLPNLKQLWSADPDGILNFKKLWNINVSYCDELRNLFPASVVEDVPKLESVSALYCEKMVEIVASEDASETNNDLLVFPELSYVALYGLSNIKHFYMGRHLIKCPKLKELTLDDSFPIQKSKTTNEERHFFSAEKVFPNLEYLKIDFNEAKNWLSSHTFKYQMHRLKELIMISVESVDLLYQFLKRMPNLEKLSLYFSALPEGLVPIANIARQERSGTVLQLKELFLYDSSMKDLGLQVPFLQRLELLGLYYCNELSNLAPPSVSFAYLTYLEVMNCKRLRNLMASSTAKTMLQLKTMKVIGCYEVEQIVTNDEGSEEKIVFSKLSTIELVGLNNLQSFCSYQNCQFAFPSLDILIIRECVKMKTFTEGITEAPKLENIFVVEGEGNAKWQWEGNLNATIQKSFNDKLYFTYCQDLILDRSSEFIIEQLWNGSHSVHQNSFRYLKTLTAFGCHTLVHVIPSHLLSCFENLEELQVSDCREAQVIFNISDEIRNTKAPGIIRLKALYLDGLPKLEHIWDKDPEGIIALPMLEKMYVNYCDCLKSVFPASVAKDLTRLEELEVTDCRELVEIFWKDEEDAEGEGRTQEFVVFSSLSSLRLEKLPGLKYCILDSEEEAEFLESACSICLGSWPIPNSCFGFLDSLILDGCHFSSDLLLPFNLLPFLTNLETLEVGNSDSVKTIFDVKCTAQDTEITSMGPTLLFSLKNLTLSNLSNLENVWNEDPCGILNMQHLQKVHVEKCKCLTSVFPTSVVKDVDNLDELVVKDCEGLMTIVAEDNTDPSRTNVELTCPCVTSLELQGLPNFRYFYVCGKQCDIFPDEDNTEKPTSNMHCLSLGQNGVEMISRGELQRTLLHSLKVLILCFWVELDEYLYKVLQEVPNIERLVVCDGSFKEIFCSNVDCSGLVLQLKVLHLVSLGELVSVGLNLVAFNLTYLKVHKCNRLRYLLTSSTAKSLSQLKRMEISWCDSIEEIVSKEGEESDEDEIIFPQLSRLNLEYLKNLKSFYKGCLNLPSLEEMSVTDCDKMITLCTGTVKADKLSHVTLQSFYIPLETDLNSTMLKEFLREKDYVEFRDRTDLQEIWCVSVDIPYFCFEYLKTLIVDGCKLLSDVLPFTLLPLLPEIETMEVRNCDSVKTIFDVKSTTKDKLITFPLKKLVLSKLPNLENIWNENPHGIVCMKHLQEVDVENCKCLTSVFPASVAKDLVQLENLAVKHCEELMAIVGEDNPADPKGTNLLQLTFPCMKSLTLWDLPKFKYNSTSIYCIHDATATFQLITPNLQHLILGENELKMIKDGEFQGNHLHKLKVLTLCFHIESDVFPEYAFLQQVPNVGKLVVSSGSFKQIFCLQSPDNVDYRLLLQLKELQLESLGKLVSIGLENSWIEPFVRNLETLQVISCSSLTNLVPGTVSLSNLTHLKVECCNSLLYLFTSSTGKSLAQLKRMEIKLCPSMKEIASEEGDESNEDEEIIFERLQVLYLEELDELRCFYPGKFTLRFPSLEKVYVIKCGSMKSFSKVNKIDVSTKWYSAEDATPREESDLNSALRRTSEEEAAEAS